MRKIDAVIEVGEDGEVRLELDESVAPGRHKAQIILDDGRTLAGMTENDRKPMELPVIRFGYWPNDIPLHRNELYDERGR